MPVALDEHTVGAGDSHLIILGRRRDGGGVCVIACYVKILGHSQVEF